MTRPAPDFATGERVDWVGAEHLFSKPVIIAAARFEHFVTLNIPDGWVYDIADPDTGKILLYAAKASELVRPDVIYHGVYREAGGSAILVETAAGELLGMVRHVAKHSPTGIGWGYAGSGAADCARSLLIAALGEAAARCPTCHSARRLVITGDGERPYDPAADADTDPELLADCWDCDDGYRRMPYQQFKFDYVAKWDNDWRMSRADILAWLARNGVNA